MGVKDAAARRRAGFVGLEDILARMASLDGASVEDSASLLHQLLKDEDQSTRPHWYACDRLNGKRLANDSQVDFAWRCLEVATRNGVPPPSRDDEIRSGFWRYGFEEAEIVAFLAKHGVDVGVVKCAAGSAPDGAWPQWKQIMSLAPVLSVRDAIYAFAGIDPHACGFPSDEDSANVAGWSNVIERAIAVRELEANGGDFGSNGKLAECCISPEKLADWCAMKNIKYPLPLRVPVPSTDAGLRDALTDCQRECTELKARLKAIEGSQQAQDRLQSHITRLEGEVLSINEKHQALVHERNHLKEDLIDGKAKSTAAKIIGGLVIVAYRMNIHAVRLEGISDVVRDLEKMGAAVDEKTLRGWIKEAAKVVESTKAKT